MGKFILKWNGADQVDTGYIGSNTYDEQLLAAGVPGNDINTGAVSTKNATLTFDKTLSYPNLVQLEVYSPLLNDEYTVTVTECPPLEDASFTANSYVIMQGHFYSGNIAFGETYNFYREIQETYNVYNLNSLTTCMQTIYNGRAFTYVGGGTITLGSRGEDWLTYLCQQTAYYSTSVRHFYIDSGGTDYKDLTGSYSNTLWNRGIAEFRSDFAKQDITNTYIIIYVVNPGSTYDQEILFYNWLLIQLNKLQTENGATGLKDFFDAGRLKIVNNVERNRPVTYYRDLQAEQMNALNIGLNLSCG